MRGLGLFVGLELVKNRTTREPIIPLNAKIRLSMNPKLEVAKKLAELGVKAMARIRSTSLVWRRPSSFQGRDRRGDRHHGPGSQGGGRFRRGMTAPKGPPPGVLPLTDALRDRRSSPAVLSISPLPHGIRGRAGGNRP